MRDYKFNHSGLDFDKPKRPIGRWLLRLMVLGLVIFGAYSTYQAIDWDDTGETLPANDDPNVIPLKIPPNKTPNAQTDDGKVGTNRQQERAITAAPETIAAAVNQPRMAGWIDHNVQPGETLTRIFHPLPALEARSARRVVPDRRRRGRIAAVA